MDALKTFIRWVGIIATTVVIAGIVFLAVGLYRAPASERLPDRVCERQIGSVVRQLIRRDLDNEKDKFAEGAVFKYDLRCEQDENMVNLGVFALTNIFNDRPVRGFYGLFHIHWGHDGVLITPAENTKTEWVESDDYRDMEAPWCDWMEGVAEDDPIEKAFCAPYWK